MIQCFVKNEIKSSFAGGTQPKLLSASNIHVDYAHHTRIMHNHSDRCELLFVRNGASRYVIDHQVFPIKKGDMVITNCGTLHDDLLEQQDNVAYYSIAIDHLQIPGLPENHLIAESVRPVFPTGEHYNVFNGLFRSIYELLVSNEPGIEETCNYLMLSVLSLVLKIANQADTENTETSQSSMIMDIRQYLDQNYMNDLSLQSISNEFHISTYYLAHIFKEETGYSPMNYIIRRRIGEAQSLLITTRRSITDIASQVGFSNPNNFNIQFQKQVGLSPRAYRKTYTIPGLGDQKNEEPHQP